MAASVAEQGQDGTASCLSGRLAPCFGVRQGIMMGWSPERSLKHEPVNALAQSGTGTV